MSSHPLGASSHCQICPMPHGQNGAVCNFYSQPWSCVWILQRAAAVMTGRNLAISSPSPCFDFLLRPPLQILPFLDTQVPVPQRCELAIQHKKDPGGLFPDLRVGRVEMWTLSPQRWRPAVPPAASWRLSAHRGSRHDAERVQTPGPVDGDAIAVNPALDLEALQHWPTSPSAPPSALDLLFGHL